MKRGIIKRCESCSKYFNCKIYDKICQNIDFLWNFLDIKNSNKIAKYCKQYEYSLLVHPRSDNELKPFSKLLI